MQVQSCPSCLRNRSAAAVASGVVPLCQLQLLLPAAGIATQATAITQLPLLCTLPAPYSAGFHRAKPLHTDYFQVRRGCFYFGCNLVVLDVCALYAQQAPRVHACSTHILLHPVCLPTLPLGQIEETMRASAYIYNTPDEISTFVAALDECATEQRRERQGAVQGQQEEAEERVEGEGQRNGRQSCVIA